MLNTPKHCDDGDLSVTSDSSIKDAILNECKVNPWYAIHQGIDPKLTDERSALKPSDFDNFKHYKDYKVTTSTTIRFLKHQCSPRKYKASLNGYGARNWVIDNGYLKQDNVTPSESSKNLDTLTSTIDNLIFYDGKTFHPHWIPHISSGTKQLKTLLREAYRLEPDPAGFEDAYLEAMFGSLLLEGKLFFRQGNDEIKLFVNCNDFFYGGGDAEQVTNIHELFNFVIRDTSFGHLVYCIYKRKKLPIGNWESTLSATWNVDKLVTYTTREG